MSGTARAGSSVRPGSEAAGWGRVAGLGLAVLAGLGPLGGCGSGASGESGGLTAATSGDDHPAGPGSEPVRALPSLKDLGPGARRIMVIVLPGDASVEVDGNAARRRDGVIELMGKVGQSHRLRVQKGASSIERDVAIPPPGAPVRIINLDAETAAAAAVASASPGASGSAAASAPPAPRPEDNPVFSNSLDPP